MSPAPYPPFQAGDDVDASFFDQLGDELDIATSEVTPYGAVVDGKVDLPSVFGNGEPLLSSSGSRAELTRSDSCKVMRQDADVQAEFDLDNIFSDLTIANADHTPDKVSGSGVEFLPNGVVPGANTGSYSGVATTAVPVEREFGFQLSKQDSVPNRIITELLSVTGCGAENVVVPTISNYPVEAGADVLCPESNARPIDPEIETLINPEIPTKSQVQTVSVSEVQWGDFGSSAGFGSYSDFFSALSSDPLKGQEGTIGSEPDFSFAAEAPLDLSHGQGTVSQVRSEGCETFPVATTQLSPSSTVVAQVDQGFKLQEERTGSYQVSQSEWQNPYPGWWYNVVTGEWREEVSSYGGGGESSWDSSGQYMFQAQSEEQERYKQIQEQGESGSLGEQASGTVYANGHIPAGMNDGIPSSSGQSQPIQQQSLSSRQSVAETGAAEQPTSWEDQYPGWYYDYQVQEWKQTVTSFVPSAGAGDPQVSGLQLDVFAGRGNTAYERSLNGGYGTEWGSGHSQLDLQDKKGTLSGGDTVLSSNEAYVGTRTGSETTATSSSSSTLGNIVSRTWSESEASAYYPTQTPSTSVPKVGNGFGDNIGEGFKQHNSSFHQEPLKIQHVDPQVAAETLPDFASYSTYSRASAGPQATPSPQFTKQLTHEVQYNQVAASYVPNYGNQTSQVLNGVPVQHLDANSYFSPHQPVYASLTPPRTTTEALRTSVGRPPTVLSTFGFGGKLVVVKLRDRLNLRSADGKESISSGQACGPIQVHNLGQIATTSAANQSMSEPGNLYFGSLLRPSLSGPLSGTSVSSKELFKWLDERAASCRVEEPFCKNPATLCMLWSLLKVACQHYGKLRSAVGSSGLSQEDDGPEAAVGNVLTSGTTQGSWTMGSFASTVCLQPVPSEHQMQATASEVKKLLVVGKRKEALQQALQGQLWGPSLILARQLGEKPSISSVVKDPFRRPLVVSMVFSLMAVVSVAFYTDAVAKMAHCLYLPGSPLRTLSLLIAGQQAEVFNENSMSATLGIHATQNISQQDGLGSMLEDWQENLSIMAANRTSGDERVISHLGDCLWKVKGELGEIVSGRSRSLDEPRTYATPEAIQRTEVYEYSKILGNPQYILLSFQPYKLIYASMLAEAGRISEALRYCQAVLKTLKTASRAPDVETFRQTAVALEDRLRVHSQGFIGGPPQTSDPTQQTSTLDAVTTLHDSNSLNVTGFSSRNSPPIVPSLSAEKLNNVRKSVPTRSVSEPDFGSASMTGKEVGEKKPPGPSVGYLGRLSSSLFQKAGGIVGFRKKEAKLGEKNKFYYNEQLKQWVEEGAEPVEEVSLPPPPTASKTEELTESGGGLVPGPKSVSGTPPVPPTNQFSARAKSGVRSRYVDTFNKGGNVAPSKPAASSLFPAGRVSGAAPTSFFVPGPTVDSSSVDSTLHTAKLADGTFEGNGEVDRLRIPPGSIVGVDKSLNGSQSNASPLLFQQDTSTLLVSADGGSWGVFSGGSTLPNGFHSRANSWSGYPSNYQSSQSVIEQSPKPSEDLSSSSASYKECNGSLSQSSVIFTSPGSYFPSAFSKDVFPSSSGDVSVEHSLPALPIDSITTFKGPVISDGNGSHVSATYEGNDLQEVEL